MINITFRGEEAIRIREYCLMREIPMSLLLKECTLIGLAEKAIIDKEKILRPTKKPEPVTQSRYYRQIEEARAIWELSKKKGNLAAKKGKSTTD